MAVDLAPIHTAHHLNRIFHLTNHDLSVSSAVNRSGHARFRRGPPSDSLAPSISSQLEGKLINDSSVNRSGAIMVMDTDKTVSFQSLDSSLPGGSLEGSVSKGIVAPALSFSSRKPPLPSSHRKRNGADRQSGSVQGSGREDRSVSVSGSGCHCCKRRKTGLKREVRKIPIVGSKVESIPADDYSWKKYGEKKVAGSPFPRVYYKCNSVKGCPARKSIELALTDSKMFVVTYDREHRHTPPPLAASLNGLQIHST